MSDLRNPRADYILFPSGKVWRRKLPVDRVKFKPDPKRSFKARYEQRCGDGCGHKVLVGDLVYRHEGGGVRHKTCPITLDDWKAQSR